MEIPVGVKLIIRILYNAHIWYKKWFCNKGVVNYLFHRNFNRAYQSEMTAMQRCLWLNHVAEI